MDGLHVDFTPKELEQAGQVLATVPPEVLVKSRPLAYLYIVAALADDPMEEAVFIANLKMSQGGAL